MESHTKQKCLILVKEVKRKKKHDMKYKAIEHRREETRMHNKKTK